MKKRILVVENNPDILELIAVVLDEAGYETNLFANEKDIFESIVKIQPDAVLLDIIQITEQGTELCKHIKKVQETCHIPVIVLSTHPHIKKVKEVCADEVVAKPFDIDSLIEILEEQLNKVSI